MRDDCYAEKLRVPSPELVFNCYLSKESVCVFRAWYWCSGVIVGHGFNLLSGYSGPGNKLSIRARAFIAPKPAFDLELGRGEEEQPWAETH